MKYLFTLSFWMILTLFSVPQPGKAVILYGSGDPAYNTTPPTGALTNSGWQFEGQWGCFLGTPIAPQYFLAAHHIGGAVGQPFTFMNVTYTTVAYWDDPASDLRLWQISGTFPNYAPLYTNNLESGSPLVVFGRGTQRSSAVMVNGALAGWQDGISDGVMRWGQNKVFTAYWSELIVAFTGTQGTNEAYLSPGDSSGAIFIPDNGTWKLAGINYAIDGPFATTANGPAFDGAIFNENGLYVNNTLVSDAQPAYFYGTRVSTEIPWILSITGAIPNPTPAPLTPPTNLTIQWY